MKLNFQYADYGATIQLEVDCFNTISEIKQQVYENLGMPVADQVLLHNGQELMDERTVLDYHIQSYSLINVLVRAQPPQPANDEKLNLRILRSGDATGVSVEVDPSDRISVLRSRLLVYQHLQNFRLPFHEYLFLYEGEVLVENRTFQAYDMKDNDSIRIYEVPPRRFM